MEPEGSLPHSHVPTTCLYPEPAWFSPTPASWRSILILILPSTPGSSKWSLFRRFPYQNPVYTSPFPHKCYMSRPFILIVLITWTTLGEKYTSLSSSLCGFLHFPHASSLLGWSAPVLVPVVDLLAVEKYLDIIEDT
jgi:hypothetical protein